MEGTLVSLLNVYAPPGSEWSFYKRIFEILATKSQGILICGGDFNVRLNPRLDSSRGNSGSKGISKKINTVTKETGIKDVWREMYPSSRDYAHYSSPHATYSRIDYFFTFNRDLHRIAQCDIGLITLSDHSPMYMSVYLNSKSRSTLWRLNSNILNNPQTKEKLQNEIKTYLELNDNDKVTPSVLWDALKAVIRGKIIATTSHDKKIRKQRLQSLEDKLKQLQREHADTLNEETKSNITKIRKEIDKIKTNRRAALKKHAEKCI